VRLHLCGTRGSTPAPGPEFVRYGGHTSSVALAADGAGSPSLILDAGTGLRTVTGLLAGRPFTGTIVLTHLHWDHVHGLPFFRSGDCEGAKVRLLIPEQADGTGVEAALERGMSPPHFPIRPAQLRGHWTFAPVSVGSFSVGPFTVEAREVPHKGGTTFGYRVSDERSAIAYIPDHCPTAYGPGPDGFGAYHEAALDLAADVDVLLHDSFLVAEEVTAEAFFGHAAAEYAVGLGAQAGARQVVLFHHRPDRTDAELDKLACRFTNAPVPVSLAADGEILSVGR
jgi:phosphoribosyl 1,2-cyclic phosphodiesterase